MQVFVINESVYREWQRPPVYFSVRCQLSDQTQSYRPSKQYYIMEQPSEREVRSSQHTLYAVYTHTANASRIRQLWAA